MQENLEAFMSVATELNVKGLDFGESESKDYTREDSGEDAKGMDEKFSTGEKVEKDEFEGEDQSQLDELNNKIKSMMMLSEKRFGRKNERGRICRVCGKEGKISVLMPHIEARHISGFSYSCQLCGYTANTRTLLKVHKRKHEDDK